LPGARLKPSNRRGRRGAGGRAEGHFNFRPPQLNIS
jgi:hypothetical protein